MVNYKTADVAAMNSADVNAILAANNLPITGTLTERRGRIVDEEIAMNATPTPTPAPAIISGPITSFDGALNARSFASPNATGAETAPLKSYVFATDSLGQPKLIGASWVDGQIVSDKYAPVLDATGNELETQPAYVGKEKSVKFVIVDNITGNEYRLSGSSFEAAHKAAGSKMSFAAREMSQTVAEVGGYPRATVVLK